MLVYDSFMRMVIDRSSKNFIDVNDNNFAGITFKQFRIAKIHVENF